METQKKKKGISVAISRRKTAVAAAYGSQPTLFERETLQKSLPEPCPDCKHPPLLSPSFGLTYRFSLGTI
jgi:hypothetical protein